MTPRVNDRRVNDGRVDDGRVNDGPCARWACERRAVCTTGVLWRPSVEAEWPIGGWKGGKRPGNRSRWGGSRAFGEVAVDRAVSGRGSRQRGCSLCGGRSPGATAAHELCQSRPPPTLTTPTPPPSRASSAWPGCCIARFGASAPPVPSLFAGAWRRSHRSRGVKSAGLWGEG